MRGSNGRGSNGRGSKVGAVNLPLGITYYADSLKTKNCRLTSWECFPYQDNNGAETLGGSKMRGSNGRGSNGRGSKGERKQGREEARGEASRTEAPRSVLRIA